MFISSLLSLGVFLEVDLEQPGLSSFYDLKASQCNSKSCAEKKYHKGSKAENSRKVSQ
jgi:hypothetical protein